MTGTPRRWRSCGPRCAAIRTPWRCTAASPASCSTTPSASPAPAPPCSGSRRRRAYEVVRRSRAWGALIEEHHPRAVRLSIHPQRAGAEKFGLRLLDAADPWTTPWHSCVVHHPDGRRELMHRAEAERLGRTVLRNG
ncbi:L-tyrosine/L-tryptophan isonitrile synthase family protein [Kitasatospora arboriphila]